MQRVLLAILGSFLAFCVQAADVQVSADMPWPVIVADRAEVIREASPSLTLVDVQAPDGGRANMFEPMSGKPVRVEDHHNASWVRVALHNADPSPLALRLVMGSARVQRVDFYVVQGDSVQHSATGSGVALADQAWPGRDAGVEFTLPAGSTATVYARVSSQYPVGLTPKLYSPQAYAEREHRAALWDGTLIGGLLALAWSALLICVFSRSLPFLWLSILCVLIALFEATYRGYGQAYLWPAATDWGYRSATALGMGTSIFFALFVLGVAQREGIRLPLRRLFIASAAMQGVVALWAAFGPFHLIAHLGTYSASGFYALGLVMAVFLMRRTAPSARLMVIVMAFALFNALLRKAEALGFANAFSIQLGMDIHPNPVVALVGLATNLAVLAAWIHQVAVQREAAHAKLARWQQQEQDRLRAEVDRQMRALNQALEYAEEKNRQRVQMLGYITHDLRAPLATIAGYTKLLQEAPSLGYERHVQAIDRSVKYQLALVDDLLEFAREELQPLQIVPVDTDFGALLDDVGDFAAALAAPQENRFILEARTRLPARVRLDARRLQQVLLNLLSNAAKYTRGGCITLVTEASQKERDWLLRFAVVDTGIGISLPQQTTVFEAFKQIQSAYSGVGLGLFIAQRVVEGMGGTLQVCSAPGQGSTFSFDIPTTSIGTSVKRAGILRDERSAAPHASGSLISVAPPAHLRANLAVLARDGRLSDIEDWLAASTEMAPESRPFLNEVERLLQTLDFERIEQLALGTQASGQRSHG